MAQTFVCDRCGRELPVARMKEVMHEEGRRRVREELCPNCLDAVMNESADVRGIVGAKKSAAVHINRNT